MNRVELVRKISLSVRVPPAELARMLSNAPYRYRHYQIKKRSGGMRDIYQPTASLKEVQRSLISGCLSLLPVSDSVYSYREGIGIRQHAAAHARSNYFTRLDLVDFFSSINGLELVKYLKSMRRAGYVDLDDDALGFVVSCLCRRKSDAPGVRGLALTIGAPSSPWLSNAILYEFDECVRLVASKNGGVYTRYADDIFVSGNSPAVVENLEVVVRASLKKLMPFFAVNERKVRRFSRKSRVRLCGVNISSDRQLSVGRDIKKLVRSKIHWALSGRLDTEEINQLKGWVAYIDSIEPGYKEKITLRVGKKAFDSVMNGYKPA